MTRILSSHWFSSPAVLALAVCVFYLLRWWSHMIISVFPCFWERRKLLPLSTTSLYLFQLVTPIARKEMRWRRQRQTDNLCADVFSFSDWCVWDCRSISWEVSQAPRSITTVTATSSRELIDLRAGCQCGLGPPQAARHCCLHSATVHVSLHATLLTLSSAREVSQRACWKNQLVATKPE